MSRPAKQTLRLVPAGGRKPTCARDRVHVLNGQSARVPTQKGAGCAPTDLTIFRMGHRMTHWATRGLLACVVWTGCSKSEGGGDERPDAAGPRDDAAVQADAGNGPR